MRSRELDYDEIIQQADKRLGNRTKRMAGCLRQCGLLVIVMPLSILIANLFVESLHLLDWNQAGWLFALFFAPWMLYILFWHVGAVLIEMIVARNRQRAIHREIERQLWLREGRVPSFVKPRRQKSNQKQKNEMLLSDDGDIVSLDDYLDEQQYYGSSS